MSDWFADNRQRALDELFDLLRIQSISTDPAFQPEIARAQAFLQAHLARSGFEHVQLLHGPGHACIYADWLHAPGRPTVLIYGHYDVQPADPPEKWRSPPFEPTVRDGRVYARGASDDKGPLFVALTALEAMLATKALACNVKLLIEGEEELGSRHLGEIAAKHRDLLGCDFLLSADGARWRPDLPAVNIGNRGIVTLEFGLTTAAKDLHSGRYGGTVANALNAIAGLVATLHDARGRVAVAGFYDGVAEPTNSERAELAALPFDDAAYYEAVGASEPVGESGYSTLERQWLRPTLDLNGLWGGYQGVGGKTVIPCEAHAKISCRLVPGQAPDRIAQLVRAHLERHCPKGARLDFTGESHGSPAYALPPDHPALLTVEDVFTEVNGQRPVRVRIGATLPIGTMFHDALGIDTVMFSFATADEDFHAPNEFFRLASFDEGVRAWRLCLERLGRQSAETYRAFRRN